MRRSSTCPIATLSVRTIPPCTRDRVGTCGRACPGACPTVIRGARSSPRAQRSTTGERSTAAMSNRKQTGAEELRHIVNNLNATQEWVWDEYTAEQILTLHRAWMASGWDIYPDAWTKKQRDQAANSGIIPQFDPTTEKPTKPIYALNLQTSICAKCAPSRSAYRGSISKSCVVCRVEVKQS